MPIESNIKVVGVGPAGVTVWEADEKGTKDGSSRMFFAPIYKESRLFATPLAAYMWTCDEGVWQVASVTAKVSVTGGTSCTVDVLVSPGVVAPAGTTQLTAVMDIEATAPFFVTGTLITTPTQIFPGDSLSRVIAGTVGSLEGVLTVKLKRVA